MANILEYLDWRGDIPFSVDGFNSVDNLILAMIAYTDFEGVLDEGEILGITDASEKYFQLHTEDEVMNTFFKMAPFVLKKAAETKRFGNIILENYVNIVDPECDEQFSAISYKRPDGTIYVAFRGTDNTLVGWREDFNLSFMSETAGQKRAVTLRYMRRLSVMRRSERESGWYIRMTDRASGRRYLRRKAIRRYFRR